MRDGGGRWTERAYLKAPSTGTADQFGISVAIGDDTLAVGAWGEDSSGTGVDAADNDGARDAGAVYTFDARQIE